MEEGEGERNVLSDAYVVEMLRLFWRFFSGVD